MSVEAFSKAQQSSFTIARMAELADALHSGCSILRMCRFKSCSGHVESSEPAPLLVWVFCFYHFDIYYFHMYHTAHDA
jgi:hypothetical protein